MHLEKSKLNLVIDLILLLLLSVIAGIGLLIKYVLVPGIQRNTIYGTHIDLEFWGMNRHEWGDLHLYLGFLFLTLLLIHILLHWKMAANLYRHLLPNKTIRLALTILLAVATLLALSFPLFVKPTEIQKEVLHQKGKGQNSSTASFSQP
ncbi:MAG: DUF4405 domain-containing protein [Massilibacteroides sp.]|nr:DUF4405 domain-containing protein [Massilibacteroides sp.]MDD4115340.1 DUF4405 domain-containing protein [Massilibacteroides sp.]